MLFRGETRPVASQNVGCFLRLYIYPIEATILFTTYKVKKVERMWLVLKNIFLEFGKLGSSFSLRVTFLCSFNRPFHCFFQLLTWTSVGYIRRHHWKEHLTTSKIAKFESDLLKTNEETTSQSREILQTFVWCVCGGGGSNFAPSLPSPYHTNICKFSQLCGAISSLA